jgi:4-hydroxybenzoate polyprenyltransferase
MAFRRTFMEQVVVSLCALGCTAFAGMAIFGIDRHPPREIVPIVLVVVLWVSGIATSYCMWKGHHTARK